MDKRTKFGQGKQEGRLMMIIRELGQSIRGQAKTILGNAFWNADATNRRYVEAGESKSASSESDSINSN